MTMPRGIRNNNPGNIRKTGDKWAGLSAIQTDSDFFQFTAPEFGIRAMTRTLRNYQTRYGLETVAEIISRWAPSNENNTQAYIASVAGNLGVNPYEPINVNDVMPELLQAIIYHENGQQPYDIAIINEGITLA